LLGSFFISDFMTIHKNVIANWDNTGDHPRDVVFYSDFIQLERENARLRAIFPRLLEALQSGACAPDCSAEFFEMIPNEVAGVMRKLRMPNTAVRRAEDGL
jgi:hypothetical protein